MEGKQQYISSCLSDVNVRRNPGLEQQDLKESVKQNPSPSRPWCVCVCVCVFEAIGRPHDWLVQTVQLNETI